LSCETDAMTKLLVWNCGDEYISDDMKRLEWAKEEVQYLELLRPRCEVTVAPPSLEWNDLARFAKAVKPTIFHFIGHGDAKGQLFVRDGGKYFGRSAASIIRVVRSVSSSLEGVYLSACFSATDGPELLDSLPPVGGWAIGTGLKVDDDLAAKFSEKFYQHLVIDAGTPKEAYEVAYSYALADWDPDEVPHAAWFKPSPLPPVDEMEQTISDQIWKIFSRPAFKIPMRHEVSIKDLNEALQAISHSLGTGQVLSRQYETVIDDFSLPSKWLQDPEIDKFVRSAGKKIAATQKALAVIQAGAQTDYIAGNVQNFPWTDTSEDEWMELVNAVDSARNQVLKAANALFVRNNLLPFRMIDLSYDEDLDIAPARARAGKP
jgi:hypothetical protein